MGMEEIPMEETDDERDITNFEKTSTNTAIATSMTQDTFSKPSNPKR